jgi:microcystin-dependent protein
MASYILSNADLKSYDVTSGNQSITLDAVKGKQTTIVAYGTDNGFAVTITYGANTKELAAGESATILYDGTTWHEIGGSTGGGSSSIVKYDAGADLTGFKVMAVNDSGEAIVADKGDATKVNVIGVSTESVLTGNPIEVQKLGLLDGFTGLVVGQQYFLGDAGALTTRSNVGIDETLVYIGTAQTSTILDIDINILSSTRFQDPEPIGKITPFAGTTVPAGHLLCNGQAVSRSRYSDLFTVISTSYGSGDGSTTFNVPDLRETVPVGIGSHGTATQNDPIVAVGTFRDDQFQGHYHETIPNTVSGVTTGATGYYFTSRSGKSPTDDGTNGTPRTGTTTHGKELGVNYIIKAERLSLPGNPGGTAELPVNDISSSSATTSCNTLASYPQGYIVRVSWSDGTDNTTNHSFSDASGYTIGGIAASEWVGYGDGYLDLRYKGSNAFDVLNTNGIWSWGTFSGDYFEQRTDGIMKQNGTATFVFSSSSSQTTTVTFPVEFSAVPKFLHHPTDHIAGTGLLFAYQQSIATTTANAYPGLWLNSGTTSLTKYSDWVAEGRWTASTPIPGIMPLNAYDSAGGTPCITYDISSATGADETCILPDASTYQGRIRVEWSGGDGTYEVTFSDTIKTSTGDVTTFKGRGNGSLEFESINGSWYAIGEGVYDTVVDGASGYEYTFFLNGDVSICLSKAMSSGSNTITLDYTFSQTFLPTGHIANRTSGSGAGAGYSGVSTSGFTFWAESTQTYTVTGKTRWR